MKRVFSAYCARLFGSKQMNSSNLLRPLFPVTSVLYDTEDGGEPFLKLVIDVSQTQRDLDQIKDGLEFCYRCYYRRELCRVIYPALYTKQKVKPPVMSQFEFSQTKNHDGNWLLTVKKGNLECAINHLFQNEWCKKELIPINQIPSLQPD